MRQALGYRWLVLAVVSLLLTACAGGQVERDPTAGWTAERLYREAVQERNARNWARSAELLETLESRFPFGVYAQQAQMDLAFVRWKEGELSLALAAVDRFMRLHPEHAATDYMLYLRGLINFYREVTIFTRLTEQDPSERDQRAARDSFASFRELVERFPDSSYAPDALDRMAFLHNSLAQNEVNIARFYLSRGAYLAAVNRAQAAIRDFDGAPSTFEALQILVQSYDALGLTELRDDSQRILDLNFPNGTNPAAQPERSGPWWRFW